MNKMFKVVEIAWIVVAVLSAIEVYRLWGTFDQKFFIFLGFMVVAVVMFFFRRKQRQRLESRNK